MPTQVGQSLLRQVSDGGPDGTVLGNSTVDFIGFYGATPIIQQTNTVSLLTQLVNLGLIASGTANQGGGVPINITTAQTLTTANAGKINTINSAAGIALVMPAATGTGNTYTFFIGTTVTSIGTTITAGGSDKITGSAYQTGASGAATARYIASGTTITLNGTTTGGIKGDLITYRDVATALWSVEVLESITGTAATPFS